MLRLVLPLLLVLTSAGCSAHGTRDAARARFYLPETASENRLANLERAARYPWQDDGRCAVRESSGDWATLIERCYDALDRSRIRFVDHQGVCSVAQAATIRAEDLVRMVGICLLVQPELAAGAVIGQATGKDTKALQFLTMQQLLFKIDSLFFVMLALGDVPHC